MANKFADPISDLENLFYKRMRELLPGIQIKVYREFKPMKDSTEFTVYLLRPEPHKQIRVDFEVTTESLEFAPVAFVHTITNYCHDEAEANGMLLGPGDLFYELDQARLTLPDL